MPASGPEALGAGAGAGWTTSAAPTLCFQLAPCAYVVGDTGTHGELVRAELVWQAEAQRVTRTGRTWPPWHPFCASSPPHSSHN